MPRLQKSFVFTLSALLVSPSLSRAGGALGTPHVLSHPQVTTLAAGQKLNSTYVSDWIYEYEGSMMRAELDATVAKLLETDPDARTAMAAILQSLDSVTDVQETSLDLSMSRSSKTIDPENPLRKMVQLAAKGHGFTQSAIDNAKLWTTIGSVNAYTFSASHDRLNVVTFQDLVDVMGPMFEGISTAKLNTQQKAQKAATESAMVAIYGHELGHIKSKHVLTGMVIAAVYQAVGRNMIPDEDKATSWQALTRIEARKQLMSSLDWAGPSAEKVADQVIELTARVGDHLIQTQGKAMVARLANKLNAAFGKGPLFQADGSLISQSLAQESAANDPKSFKASQTNLTRSQERTADRWAVLVTGSKALSQAMAKLAGGRNASAENIMMQAEQVLEKAASGFVDLSTLDTQDHPGTVVRVAAAMQFEKSPNYQIMKDPFLKALDMETKIQADISTMQSRLDGNQVEQILADQLQFKMAALHKYSSELQRYLIKELAAESKAQVSSRKAEMLLEYIDKLKMSTLALTVLPKLPFLADLQTQLKTLNTPMGQTVAAEIATRASLPETANSIQKIRSSMATGGATCPQVLK